MDVTQQNYILAFIKNSPLYVKQIEQSHGYVLAAPGAELSFDVCEPSFFVSFGWFLAEVIESVWKREKKTKQSAQIFCHKSSVQANMNFLITEFGSMLI